MAENHLRDLELAHYLVWLVYTFALAYASIAHRTFIQGVLSRYPVYILLGMVFYVAVFPYIILTVGIVWTCLGIPEVQPESEVLESGLPADGFNLADGVTLPTTPVGLAVVGQSGSGKTTYLAKILRELEPDTLLVYDPHSDNPQGLANQMGVEAYTSKKDFTHALVETFEARQPATIVIDEANYYLQGNKAGQEALANILMQGRKYGQQVTLAAQSMKATTLSSDVRDNIQAFCILTIRKHFATNVLGYTPEQNTEKLRLGEVYIAAVPYGVEGVYHWSK